MGNENPGPPACSHSSWALDSEVNMVLNVTEPWGFWDRQGILNEWQQPFMEPFLISIQLVYLQPYLVVTGLVPHEAAAVSAHVLCTPYDQAPVYSVTSFQATYVGCMCVQL